MINLWAWNELASELDGNDEGMELILAHGVSNSTWERRVLVNHELIRCRAWGAGGGLTPADCGSLSDPTRPLRHSQDGTHRQLHKAGTHAWIEGTPGELDLDQLNNDPDDWLSSFNGQVNVIIPDGRGGWYVGGNFTIPATRLLHLNAALEVDLGFTAAADAAVLSLWLSPDQTRLVVGGSFGTINGDSAQFGAILDAATGVVLTDLAADAELRSIVHHTGDHTWLAGDFTGINGQPDQYFSRVNWRTGANTSTDYWVDIGGGSGITSLAWDEEENALFMVGSFTDFNSGVIPRSGAAAVSMDLTLAVEERLLPWEPVFNAVPEKIRIKDDWVYACGNFTTINGVTLRRLARVDKGNGLGDTTWAPDALGGTVRDFIFHDDSTIAVGEFTDIGGAVRSRAGIVDATAVATSWSTAPNAAVRTVAVSGGRMAIGGNFTSLDADGAAEDYIGVWTDFQVHSVVGRYRLEYVEDYDSANPTQNILWRVYKVDASGEVLIHESDQLTEAVVEHDGVHWTGPDVLLTDPGDPLLSIRVSYVIAVVRVFKDGTTDTEYTAQYVGSDPGIFIVPDGEESGDPWTEADAWAAPGVAKLVTTYTITPPTLTTTPVVTNQKQFFRVWAISTTYFDNLEIDWTGSTENIPLPLGGYFHGRIWGNFNAAGPNYTLTIEARDGVAVQQTNGGETVDVDNATSNVFPDQIQVEREVDTGPLTGPQGSKVISDWQPVPVTFQYVDQGPGAWTYRYRCRFRDFRRDGINDERGPIEKTSAWSAWSAWV